MIRATPQTTGVVFTRFILLLMALASCQPQSSPPKDTTTDSCGNGLHEPCARNDYQKFKCGPCNAIFYCTPYDTGGLKWTAAGDRPCECVTEEGNLDTAREECQYGPMPG
jgi:hypothetical protein